jgi:hypothetical protein
MQTQAFWSKECSNGESDLFVCMQCFSKVYWRRVPSPDCPECHAVSTYEPFTFEEIRNWGSEDLINKAVELEKERLSNCLESQAGGLAATRHGVPLFSIALRMVSSLRMQAVNANFFAFPA